MPKELWKKVRLDAEAQADYDIELDITGYDSDQRMIDIAKANAMEAGLAHSIQFKQRQVADFDTDKKFGIMVSNPPYGERLGDPEEAYEIYREMGEAFRPHETWSKYIITSDLDFEEHYGQRATKKRKLYNGYLRTDYFQYWGKRK